MEISFYKVRDKRNKGWFYLDNDYLDAYGKIFGAVGTAVYLSLSRHADSEQKCFPSEKLMAEEFGITDRTVRTYLKRLESAHIICIERNIRNKRGKWRHNVYWLLDKSEWKSPAEITSYGHRGKIKTNPEESVNTSQRKQFPRKDTHVNYTYRNKTHTRIDKF